MSSTVETALGKTFVNPETVLENVEILPGMVVADFGAGAGFYALAAARKAGNSGKVFALDIRKEALELIRSKSRQFGISHIEPIWADLEMPEGSHLKDGTADLIIISNILFQIREREMLAREAFRITKQGGRVLLVEWRKEGGSFGPPFQDRIGRDEALELFQKAGFSPEKEFDAGGQHYGLVLKKP